MFDYDGPMLWTFSLLHDPTVSADQILGDVDAVINRLATTPPSQADMDRALTKIRASLYDMAGDSTRFGLVDLLASFALFDDDPSRINRIEAGFRAVTPQMVSKVAREYLRKTNRTVLIVEPGAAGHGGKP
jgi:predicted Zn-dependent peptidase